MATATATPADIYAEQLIPLGYGYPLWQPEPTKHGEVLIGDVGFTTEGRFYRLFNAMRSRDDPVNARGVPEEFEVLAVDDQELFHANEEFLPAGPLHTTSVTSRKVSAGVAAEGAPQAGGKVSYSFTCNGKQGATVTLGSPGKQELLLRNQTFREYVYNNHAYWYDFALKKKHEVQPSDIILVSGFVKTSEWALNIFGNSSKSHEFSVEATVGDFVSADFSVAADAHFDMPMVKRAGPPKRSPIPTAAPNVTIEDVPDVADAGSSEADGDALAGEDVAADNNTPTNASPSANALTSTAPIQTNAPGSAQAIAPVASANSLPSNQCLFLRYYVVSDRPLRGAVVKELPGRHTGQQEYAADMCCFPFTCFPMPGFCKRKPRPPRKPKRKPVVAEENGRENEHGGDGGGGGGIEMVDLAGTTPADVHLAEVPAADDQTGVPMQPVLNPSTDATVPTGEDEGNRGELEDVQGLQMRPGNDIQVDEIPQNTNRFIDPVHLLADRLAEVTSSSIAVASHYDLYVLVPRNERWPEDVGMYLREVVTPENVRVDEHGAHLSSDVELCPDSAIVTSVDARPAESRPAPEDIVPDSEDEHPELVGPIADLSSPVATSSNIHSQIQENIPVAIAPTLVQQDEESVEPEPAPELAALTIGSEDLSDQPVPVSSPPAHTGGRPSPAPSHHDDGAGDDEDTQPINLSSAVDSIHDDDENQDAPTDTEGDDARSEYPMSVVRSTDNVPYGSFGASRSPAAGPSHLVDPISPAVGRIEDTGMIRTVQDRRVSPVHTGPSDQRASPRVRSRSPPDYTSLRQDAEPTLYVVDEPRVVSSPRATTTPAPEEKPARDVAHRPPPKPPAATSSRAKSTKSTKPTGDYMVYAAELVGRGYGLPLWFPEPTSDVLSREVHLGDVGFVSEGRFYALFNTMHDDLHPLNRGGVPGDFARLYIDERMFVARQDHFLPAGPVYSTSVSNIERSASVNAGFVGETRLRLQTVGRRAAIAVLGDWATREHFVRCRTVDEYIREHHSSWFQYAHARGFDLRIQDLIFVTGHVKTSKWALAVMRSREGQRSLEVTVGPSSAANPSLNVSPHISTESEGTSIATRSGPEPSTLALRDSDGELPKNQCIFLEYYKLEPRRFSFLRPRYRHHPLAADADIAS